MTKKFFIIPLFLLIIFPLALNRAVAQTSTPTPTPSQQKIQDLQNQINAKGTTVIMATHNTDVVKSMGKRVVALDKGKLVRDDKKKKDEKKEVKKDEIEHPSEAIKDPDDKNEKPEKH